jgi:hypothetical protein
MAITDRMIRASKGEVDLYEEVEHDPGATAEAVIIVAVVAVASGLGLAIARIAAGHPAGALGGLISGVLGALIGWAVFAGVTYFIGKNLFHADATWEEVLRTLGYAYTPNIASILTGIPILGFFIAIALLVWVIYLTFVAIRSALDISTGQTIATILLAIIPSLFIIGLLGMITGIGR